MKVRLRSDISIVSSRFERSWTHDLVSRLAAVHQVGQQDGVLGARQAARRHLPRTLLDGDPLVVLVHRLEEGGGRLNPL